MSVHRVAGTVQRIAAPSHALHFTPLEKNMSSKLWAALAVALSIPMLQACGDSEDARVRLVNATTDYAELNLYESTNKLVDSVVSNTVSGYAGLGAGTYTLNVRSPSSSTNAGSFSQTVAKKDHYAVVAYVNAGSFETSVLTEEEDTPDSGYAKLRVLNAAAAQAAGVDVYLTSNSCSALTSSDVAVSSDVTGLESAFHTVVISSGSSTWNICVTGTGDKTDLRLSIPSVTMTNKQISTLILTKSTGGYLMNGLLLKQQGDLTAYDNTSARLRLVSDAASSGTVSATLGTTTLGSAVTSPTVGSYKLVTAGALTLNTSIGGSSLADTALTLTAGADYTLLVAGTVASPTINLITDDNAPSTSTTDPVKIRLVNGVNGLSTGLSLTADGADVADAIAFGDSSTPVNVAVSSSSGSNLTATAGSLSWALTNQTLSSGNVYTVFMLGDSSSTITPRLNIDN